MVNGADQRHDPDSLYSWVAQVIRVRRKSPDSDGANGAYSTSVTRACWPSRPAGATLKQKVNRDIVVYASGRLVHTLMEHDLVDELRLMTFPFVVGAGERLFGETSDQKPMRLVDTRTVGDGLVLLTYQPVRDT
jgi:dihydrofolate reductase